MSLDIKVNITKGWPSPDVVDKTLGVDSSVQGTLEAGTIVHQDSTSGSWKRGVSSVDVNAFIAMNDSDDPSTARGAHKDGYVQLPFGGVQGISLKNPLEIESAHFDGNGVYTVGTELSAPTGRLKAAQSTEVVVGRVSEVPYSRGNKTYLTFTPEATLKVKA